MIAALILDHRLAFLVLGGLVLGAGIPLAMAWVRLLPEDAPPFARPQESTQGAEEGLDTAQVPEKRRDPFAVAFLVFVTISYILQIPGVPRDAAVQWLANRFDVETARWIPLGVRAFFAFVPGLAGCYSLLRTNFVRIPLIAASFLVLLLWLLGPLLEAALRAS